jgi:aminopeptidase YwaD
MIRALKFLLPLCVLLVCKASAQRSLPDERKFLKTQLDALCANNMYGRGYVKDGRDAAANYIIKKFKEYKLQPVAKNGPFNQGFAFPVNTFPGKMELVVEGVRLLPGIQFLIGPASAPFTGENLDVQKINLEKIKDADKWKETLATINSSHAYILENVESFCNKMDIKAGHFSEQLPPGCYIIPESGRLSWGLSHQAVQATIFYVKEDALPKKYKKVSVDVSATFLDHARSQNVMAVAPGLSRDSFIVISTHYDHLGMMGDSLIFRGANDNASSVAVLLSLASYFVAHPQRYSILFVAFAGEEAGLLGSEFFIAHSPVPVSNIRFDINLGLMGDAKNGITVVNATQRPNEFEVMQKLNDELHYVPNIVSKGPAANSDHYNFDRAGIPAYFIYGNGRNVYYHEFADQPDKVSFENISGVEKLLIDFVKVID